MLQKIWFYKRLINKKKKSIKIFLKFFWGGTYCVNSLKWNLLCSFFILHSNITRVQAFYTECAFSINMKFKQPEYLPLHKTWHLILYLGLQLLSSSDFLQSLIHQDFVVRQASLIHKEFMSLNKGATLKEGKTSLWHQIIFAYYMSGKKFTLQNRLSKIILLTYQ